MANVTATGSISNVNVTATLSNITVTDTQSNIAVSNISSQTVNVAVTSTNSVVNVSALAEVSNNVIRPAVSAVDAGGDGSFSYNVFTGVFTYTGPNQAEANTRIAGAPLQVRNHFSNVSPVLYNASSGVFSIDSSAVFTGKTTDDLAEGSSNLYFTDSRARNVLSVSTNTPSGDGALSYSSGTGAFSFTPADVPTSTSELPEGTNLYYTDGRFDTRFATKTTSDLTEGTNLYYSNARVSAFIAAGLSDLTTSNLTVNSQSNLNGNVTMYIRDGDDNTSNVIAMGWRDSSSRFSGMKFKTAGSTGGPVRILFNAEKGHGDQTIYYTDHTDSVATSNLSGTVATIKDYNVVNRKIYGKQGGFDSFANNTISAELHNFDLVGNSDEAHRSTYSSPTITNYGAMTTDSVSPGARTTSDGNPSTAFIGLGTPSNKWPVVHADYLYGDGSNISGVSTLTNAQVVAHISTVPLTVGGNLTVSGNINATGNINYENVVDLNVQDQEITLNSNAATDATVSIIANRPTGNNAVLRWNETSDIWEFNNTGSYFPIPTSTTDLAEGTNQYFTTARANSAIDAKLSGGYGITYTGGVIETTNADVRALISATGNITYDAANGIISESLTTTDITEGNNLYYTTARANSAIGAYQGNISTAGTITATKFDTTSNVFDLANAVTNLNSIRSESANDKFTFKALLGGAATETNTGNITSDGYEVIIDSSHTYATAGNVAQKSGSTNNLNGFAVSGSFTNGSTVFSITGVTQLKNVYNGTGNIDGTNNNVSLTGDMVANMIPDNFSAVDGDQYPLPQGTVLSSANTTALVFSQAAVASQTFANTAPIAIVHGGKDASTGQLISFVSQDDAVADGTQVSSFDPSQFPMSTIANTGGTPTGIETSTTLTINLAGVTIPVGTQVAIANVTGTGASNVNGQNFFIIRDSGGGGGFNYTLATNAGLTTPADAVTLGIDTSGSFPSGTQNGDITFSVAQSTSVIQKARLYKKDTYGYPKVGPKEQDFTYTVGSSSDYTIDYSAATTSTRGRTSLEATKQVLKAPIGLTIGNATMSNRGDNDSFTNFGLNFVWDGKTPYGSEYAGSSNSTLVPQMLFKNYTDNTFASGSSGLGRGGPRLFFASSTGNIDTNEFAKYPRKSQEIGRMLFWGPTQDVGDAMSTVNPAGFISATAHADWTSSNKLEMGFVANGHGFNNGDVFLKYIDGKVVLAGGHNGSTYKGIHFAPAEVTSNGNIAQTYATLGHTWANVNYANPSANTGAKLTVTQGGAVASGSGDTMFSLDRDLIQGSTTLNLQAVGNGAVLDQDIILGNGNENTVVVVTSASADIADGNPVTFAGVGGPGAGNLNGQSFFIKAGSIFDSGGANPDSFQLFHDSGLSNAVVRSQIGYDTNPATFTTGGGNCTITTTGTTARDYTFNLASGSENLVLSTNGTTHSTFYSNGNLQIAGDLVLGDYKMPTADGTLNQVIQTDGNGTLSFGTISGSGTVTSVASGNGLTGGPITSSGTLAVGSGDGITVSANAVSVGAGYGISVSADAVAVNNSQIQAQANVAIGNNSNIVLTDNTQTITGAKTLNDITLKKFKETVVDLGNQSGNIAAVAGFNGANASIFTMTAVGSIAISEIPNVQTGGSYTIRILQDGTGSHALTSTFHFAGGDRTLSTAAGSIDVINVVYDGTYYLATLSKAYAQ